MVGGIEGMNNVWLIFLGTSMYAPLKKNMQWLLPILIFAGSDFRVIFIFREIREN